MMFFGTFANVLVVSFFLAIADEVFLLFCGSLSAFRGLISSIYSMGFEEICSGLDVSFTGSFVGVSDSFYDSVALVSSIIACLTFCFSFCICWFRSSIFRCRSSPSCFTRESICALIFFFTSTSSSTIIGYKVVSSTRGSMTSTLISTFSIVCSSTVIASATSRSGE